MRHRLPPLPRLSQGRFTSNRPRALRSADPRAPWVSLAAVSCSSVALNADRSSVHNSERQSSSTWHRPAVRTVARLLFRSSPPPGSNFSWSSPHRDVFLLPVPADYVIPGSTLRSDLTCRPEIRRDYPLNLSISLSGGKETNKDSPSNGE